MSIYAVHECLIVVNCGYMYHKENTSKIPRQAEMTHAEMLQHKWKHVSFKSRSQISQPLVRRHFEWQRHSQSILGHWVILPYDEFEDV